MNRAWKLLCIALLWLGAVAPVAALPLTLSLVPSSTTLATGQSFTVDVVIGGLTQVDGDFVQEIALESFDLSLQFDTSRLQFTSLAFGSSLGDPNDSFETFTNGPGNANGTGVVSLGEFSFLTESQLLDLQSAPFTLATLQLKAGQVAGGTLLQLINLSGSSLGGVGGLALGDQLQAPSALLVTVVPEPATAALGALGLALLVRRGRASRA